jgi:hypothetical protein
MESKPGFILALIGGIITIICGILWAAGASFFGLFFGALVRALGASGTGVGLLAGINLILAILYVVFGVISVIAGVEMKHAGKVKTGGIMAVIFGILSGNVITIIGGILGLVAAGK